jgi:hypothetical protein
MTAGDLFNQLSCYGPREEVTIDATGLKIGRHDHVDLDLAPELRELVFRAHWSDGLASDYLRTEL